jgi:SAM-dependent methyltransferase
MAKPKYENLERIVISRKDLSDIEYQISQQAHIQWYTFVRPHLSGKVLVCACGVGYGCYIIRRNTNVNSVLGVDKSKNAIDFAIENYSTANTFFMKDRIETLDHVGPFEYMVSIGTIEYLEEPKILSEMARRVNVNKIILAYPAVGSPCIGREHCRDCNRDEIKDLFEPDYAIYDTYDFLGEVEFVFMERKTE